MNTLIIGNQTLIIGEYYNNDQIVNLCKVAKMGGMRRSHKMNALVLVSDHSKMYDDRTEISSDGRETLHYTGMGKSGDQDIDYSQNRTLKDSNTNGVLTVLFEKFSKESKYIFRGRVKLVGEPYSEKQIGEDGLLRNVWMFPLEIMDKSVVVDENELENLQRRKEQKVAKAASELSLHELELYARNAKQYGSRRTISKTYNRDPFVSTFAKKRANGICDLCNEPAQFNDKNGIPYLECHHINFLSEGGADCIENVVALCVVCHKKQHILQNPNEKSYLINKYNIIKNSALKSVW